MEVAVVKGKYKKRAVIRQRGEALVKQVEDEVKVVESRVRRQAEHERQECLAALALEIKDLKNILGRTTRPLRSGLQKEVEVLRREVKEKTLLNEKLKQDNERAGRVFYDENNQFPVELWEKLLRAHGSQAHMTRGVHHERAYKIGTEAMKKIQTARGVRNAL